MYRHEDAPNFRSFAEAMKAGNSEAVVAFNPGVMVVCLTPYEDYTAGESNALWTPNSGPGERFMAGAQIHVLTFLGEFWCTGKPRFSDELARSYTQYINSFGGAVTWDVPIRADGTIRDEFLRKLVGIGRTARGEERRAQRQQLCHRDHRVHRADIQTAKKRQEEKHRERQQQ